MTSRWCSMDVRHASTVPLIRITPLLNDRTMRPEMTTPHALQHRRAFIDVHVVGDTTIIPGMPGTKIRISKVVLTAGGAAVITLKEGTRDNSGGLRVANNGNVVLTILRTFFEREG
jgi:hypothetical protein